MAHVSKYAALSLLVLFSPQITHTSPVRKALIGAASVVTAAAVGDCFIRHQRCGKVPLKNVIVGESKEVAEDVKYALRSCNNCAKSCIRAAKKRLTTILKREKTSNNTPEEKD